MTESKEIIGTRSHVWTESNENKKKKELYVSYRVRLDPFHIISNMPLDNSEEVKKLVEQPNNSTWLELVVTSQLRKSNNMKILIS